MFVDFIILRHAEKIKKKEIFYIIAVSIYQLYFMKQDSAGIVWEACDVLKKKYGGKVAGFANAILRKIDLEREEIVNLLKKEKRFDIIYSYPSWIIGMFKKVYGENYIAAMESYKKPSKLGVRVNLLKYSNNEFEEFLKQNGGRVLKKIENMYYIEGIDIVNSVEFREGKLFIQDGSSFLAAKLIGAKPGEIVLDACAAPGSKSSVIAEMMENSGKIRCIDIYDHKIKLIEENCEKLGINIIEASLGDARDVKKNCEMYDRVIIDAPCSGLGILRKKPEIVYNKKYNDIEVLANLQYEIISACAEVVKPGGTLVYSTCTFTNQENKEVIEKFLLEHSDFYSEKSEMPQNISYIEDSCNGIQIDFREEFLDGFYMIKLKKAM
jgi:16S rRNA (cytosine967-C5)-methyltransferase